MNGGVQQEICQVLSSGSVVFSQPVFDFGAHASANESTMADNTWVNGYEASHSLSSFSGPSQPTLDLNAGASVGKFSTVDDALATEYEMLRFLSTLSDPADPSQCTFDLGAGTFAAESTTIDNTWVTGYEAPQLLLALSGPAEPIFNLDAGTSAIDDDDDLTAELKALLSPFPPSGGTNQFTPPKNGPRRRRRGIVETNARNQVVIVSIDSERAYFVSFWVR